MVNPSHNIPWTIHSISSLREDISKWINIFRSIFVEMIILCWSKYSLHMSSILCSPSLSGLRRHSNRHILPNHKNISHYGSQDLVFQEPWRYHLNKLRKILVMHLLLVSLHSWYEIYLRTHYRHSWVWYENISDLNNIDGRHPLSLLNRV